MYAQSLSKETQETTEMHAAIQVLAAQRDERAANRETLMSIIQEVQNSIASRKDVQNKHKRYLDGHARFNVSELEFWQNHLCMQILGTEDGHKLKFVFSHIDERDWSREGWFELDMSKSICQVVGCSSTLGESELGRVLDTLDSTQDWSTFLKSMRLLLRNAIS